MGCPLLINPPHTRQRSACYCTCETFSQDLHAGLLTELQASAIFPRWGVGFTHYHCFLL